MTKLYTLYATPSRKLDFVMVAPLPLIIEYLGSRLLGSQRGTLERVGEVTLVIGADSVTGKPGRWLVAVGAKLPLSLESHASYLDRFPEGQRATADRAYLDGYVDGSTDAGNGNA